MEDIQDRIKKVNIEEEMRSSYIDYSMSVIVSRALPDVRDGFKPVHRRVLYGMNELGLTYSKQTKKSARVVGDVLGKYHPHGDSSVYGTLVRMGQEWILRYPLVFGQGNFGSVDGDSPAAMRYTEAKLQKIAEEVMADLEKETVDMQRTYDEENWEPTVMPTKIPQLIVNGSSGIAVGMATNMAPHNLGEAVDACVAYIDNNDITIDELMKYIKAPDFPTGGIIMGMAGIREAFATGRGRIVIRSKANIETDESGREKIIISEIPYMVNKKELIESISEMAKDKKIDGIAYINDESDKDGMRIVIEVKRDCNSNVLLNKLFKFSQLEYAFNVNNIALVNGRPKLLNMKELIAEFVKFRHDVITRRTKYELRKAQERAHILEALIVATDNIDEVVHIIRASETTDMAKQGLMKRFEFDEIQADAIVQMRLAALVNLNVNKLHNEYDELMKKIDYYNQVLASFEMRMGIVKDELNEMKAKFGDERKTEIRPDASEMSDEDFVADDDMVITISHLGYIKSTKLSEFRSQGRGGVGSRGSSSRDADFIESIYHASMRNMLMFFTRKGRCYWLRVYELPEAEKNGKGRAIQNLLSIEPDDKVDTCIKVRSLNDEEFNNSHYLIFCTKQGIIKKTQLSAYQNVRAKGVNAINLNEGDELVDVLLTDGKQEIILANKNGRAIRFNEETVRSMGRTSTGVRGIKLDEGDDEVVGMISVSDATKESILVISEKGYGKRSMIEDYRVTNRGGKGVKTLGISDKTGKLIAIKNVVDENDVMIINKSGIAIRLAMTDVRVMGRGTQGVRLINLTKRNDEIASACVVEHAEPEDIDEVTENTQTGDDSVTPQENGATETNTENNN